MSKPIRAPIRLGKISVAHVPDGYVGEVILRVGQQSVRLSPDQARIAGLSLIEAII